MEYNEGRLLITFSVRVGCVSGACGWLSSDLLGICSEWWEVVLLGRVGGRNTQLC